MSYATAKRRGANSEVNKLYPEDRAIHEWYRFVLSFPPHLVRDYLDRFDIDVGCRVLDPFCGTGTVLVECKKLGIPSVGTEANAMAYFASQVKMDWSPDPEGLMAHARRVAYVVTSRLAQQGIPDAPFPDQPANGHLQLRSLSEESESLLLRGSISPLPLHKVLTLLDGIEEFRDESYYRHERLALAKALVTTIGNLHFGPEVGVSAPKADALVVASWLANVQSMANDLREVVDQRDTPAQVHYADARRIVQVLEPRSVDAIITSPPYPNEKDYTRTTRLESVLLGFLQTKADLRALKEGLLRSNTRNVYKGDDDHEWVATHPEIQRIAEAIEARRIELGKTSGFERLYPTVTKLYFGGMARHLADLRTILRPGAYLAYVVGDQASYLQVMIRTGQILADIGQSLGYNIASIDLFRTRLATATKEQLREEVVVLRWPGERASTWDMGGIKAVKDHTPTDNGEDDNAVGKIAAAEELAATGEDDSTSDAPDEQQLGRYQRAIERAFFDHYQVGLDHFEFTKTEMDEILREVGEPAKNLPDIIYTYRSRRPLPDRILAKGYWAIEAVRRGEYAFIKLNSPPQFSPNLMQYGSIDIYNAIPELVEQYLRNDEQSLLTQILYNRLIDIFTGLTCFLIQNHYRSTIDSRAGRTEVEVDALYVGVDSQGQLHAIPIEAKSAGENEQFGKIQVSNMVKLARQNFPDIGRRVVAVKALSDGTIGIIEFTDDENPDTVGIKPAGVSRYRLIRRHAGGIVANPPRATCKKLRQA